MTLINVPGPGAYEPAKTLSPDGKYFCTKYHDSGSAALKSSASRFIDCKDSPGPGQYDHPKTINDAGRNFVSRFRSCSSLCFGNSERKLIMGSNKGKFLVYVNV